MIHPWRWADVLAQLAVIQMALAVSAKEWDAAAANFAEAATHLRASDDLIKAYEVEIGLAELAYCRGDRDAAQTLIAPILPHLPTETAGVGTNRAAPTLSVSRFCRR